MSEFGSVLKEAGWEVLPPGAYWQEFQFVGEFNTYKAGIHNETGCIELRWFDNPFDEAEAASESCVDEHQVLRIVAAVEGDDEWRKDWSDLPDGRKVEVIVESCGLRFIAKAHRHAGLWNIEIPYSTITGDKVVAFRLYCESRWEVGE